MRNSNRESNLSTSRGAIFAHEVYPSPQDGAEYVQFRQIEEVSTNSGSPLMPKIELNPRTLSVGLAVASDWSPKLEKQLVESVGQGATHKLKKAYQENGLTAATAELFLSTMFSGKELAIVELISIDYQKLMTEAQFQRAASNNVDAEEFMADRESKYLHRTYDRDENGEYIMDGENRQTSPIITEDGHKQYRRTFLCYWDEQNGVWQDVASEKSFGQLRVNLVEEEEAELRNQQQSIVEEESVEESVPQAIGQQI